MLFFKIRFSKLDFDGGKLALQNPNEEIPLSARGLQKARVNALGFAFDEIEHRLDHPGGGEDLPMICDPLF